MCSGLRKLTGVFRKRINRIANHEKLIADFETMIPKAAEAGVPNLNLFFR